MLKINEIFGPTIQGEGSNVGKLCTFIRLAGCDQVNPCKWCDTLNAFNKNAGTDMEFEDIIEKLINLYNDITKMKRIIFTGGNPCIQNLNGLISLIKDSFNDKEIEFCIETQGTVFPDWLNDFDHITISPKAPSSSIYNKGQEVDSIINFIAYNYNHFKIELKIVVFDMNDLLWAQEVFNKVKDYNIDYTIQIGTVNDNFISSTQKGFKRISPNNIIMYLYSNECKLDSSFISKVRILPQVHRILDVQ